MLLDMYPKGPMDAQPYREGQDPFEIASWFDSGNYMISKNRSFGNLWIQGGPRARLFFADEPRARPGAEQDPAGQMAPALCLSSVRPTCCCRAG